MGEERRGRGSRGGRGAGERQRERERKREREKEREKERKSRARESKAGEREGMEKRDSERCGCAKVSFFGWGVLALVASEPGKRKKEGSLDTSKPSPSFVFHSRLRKREKGKTRGVRRRHLLIFDFPSSSFLSL